MLPAQYCNEALRHTAVVLGTAVPLIVYVQDVATGSQTRFPLRITPTPQSRILSEKLTCRQVFKELPAF